MTRTFVAAALAAFSVLFAEGGLAVDFAGDAGRLKPTTRATPRLTFHHRFDTSRPIGAPESFAHDGALDPVRGTIAFWVKHAWPQDAENPWWGRTATPVPRTLFSFPTMKIHWPWRYRIMLTMNDERPGDLFSRSVWMDDIFRRGDDWKHCVFTWSPERRIFYINGWSYMVPQSRELSVVHGLFAREPEAIVLKNVVRAGDRFHIGSDPDGSHPFGGFVSDVKVWSEPLSPDEVLRLYEGEREADFDCSSAYATANEGKRVTFRVRRGAEGPNWRFGFFDGTGTKRAELPVDGGSVCLPAGEYVISLTDGKRRRGAAPYDVFAAGEVLATGNCLDRELVETWRADSPEQSTNVFRVQGPLSVGTCDGTPYLEAGPKIGNRFVRRFDLSGDSPLWCFEIDYPDDADRSVGIVIAPNGRPADAYEMSVGVTTGGDVPNSGKILTHRCLYWRRAADTSVAVQTLRGAKKGAAISAIRLYRLRSALPGPQADMPSCGRSFALYFEDPAIGYDFASDPMLREGLEKTIDRSIAYMKYVGQDAMAFPGIFYRGRLGPRYRPRQLPFDVLQAFAEKFDHAGLGLWPTVNLQTLDVVPRDRVTKESYADGSLHDTALAFQADGYPGKGWHGRPPNCCIGHPALQEAILREIDAMVDRLAEHRSLKGVCLHLTSITCLWWGGIESGYNDYCVDDFSKATGIKVPVDRKDPLRAKAYAAWLRANAYDAWVGWRCDVVTAFFARIRAHLRERRPDLRLWVSAEPTDLPATRPDLRDPALVTRLFRECGLDGPRLVSAIPDLELGVAPEPQAYRHRSYRPGSETDRRYAAALQAGADYYGLLKETVRPSVNFHDDYFESRIGADPKTTLSGDWYREIPWRCTCLNASGRHALAPFAQALAQTDVTMFSKGGFLIGTYGMEDVLVPWMREFRSLPPVRFGGECRRNGIVFRTQRVDGRDWAYAVNGTAERRSAAFDFGGKSVTFDLPPYGLKVLPEVSGVHARVPQTALPEAAFVLRSDGDIAEPKRGNREIGECVR